MRHCTKKVVAILLILIMAVGLLPLPSYADDGTEAEVLQPVAANPLPLRFICDETVAYVTVYSTDGTVISSGDDGLHHLVPGSYFYSASAEGFETISMQPFYIPDGAEGDQELRIVMTPLGAGAPQAEGQGGQPGTGLPKDTQGKETPESDLYRDGIFAAHYSIYQAFDVQRSPSYPKGTQAEPEAFTVKELAEPGCAGEMGEDDYYHFVALGPASRTGVVCSDKWNAESEGIDPYTVALYIVKDGTESEVAKGVIGAFSPDCFLFSFGGTGIWFSNTRGYHCSSAKISYTPVAGGRLVSDPALLQNCAAQSMLKPAPGTDDHTHVWHTASEDATATFYCEADGCPYNNAEYTMKLSVPAYLQPGSMMKAFVQRSAGDLIWPEEFEREYAGDAKWPEELEKNVIYYMGRDDTEYKMSTKAPTSEGTYTALVSVGYRLDPRELKADFTVSAEAPVAFRQTQIANGVVVTVSAEPGVFPANAVLSVAEASLDEAAEAAVADVRGEDTEKAASSAVSVRITDQDGAPLQGAKGQRFNVALALAEPAGESLTTSFCRILRDGEGAVSADVRSGNEFVVSCADAEEGMLYVVELLKEVTMPAQEFSGEAGGVHVAVTAPEGAFPKGTVMVVTPVVDSTVLETIEDAVEDRVTSLRAVDITFYSGNQPVEPAKPISVVLTSDMIAEAEQASVVHVEDGGAAQVLEEIVQDEDSISFDADAFSVYAIVDSVAISAEYITAEGETYVITVECPAEAKIPKDALLSVSELSKDSPEYSAYYSAALAALGIDAVEETLPARFFDISILYNGEKIEPKAPVAVRASLAYAAGLGQSVVHFDTDGPVVMETEQTEEGEIRFETESFSVYAYITDQWPASADDLDGMTLTFDRDGRYVTSDVLYNVGAPFRLGKSGDEDDAAAWTFERSGEGYGYTFYHISTTVNGEKRYLYMNPLGNGAPPAHVTLEPDNSTTPAQDWAVIRNDDGTYTLFIAYPQYGFARYYLNEWEGQYGSGFAGYFQEDSGDHLTFSPVQPTLQNGGDYAVIIKDEESGKYYAVDVDGALIEVEYDESTGRARVKLEKIHTWSYISAHDGISDDTLNYNPNDEHPDREPFNIRVDYDARGYNSYTELKEGEYYRYLSPGSPTGIFTEDAAHANHGNAKFGPGAIRYENHNVYQTEWNGYANVNTGHYLGADFENLRVTGMADAEHAATVFLGVIETVPPAPSGSYSNNETVNHIDIGIDAAAVMEYHLAYGTYYDASGNPVLTVSPGSEVTLTLTATEKIDVTEDDIIHASLKAYDKNGNELDDAYVITGFSSNQHTVHSTVQVRMEGSFKVTTLDPYDPNNPQYQDWGGRARSNDDDGRRASRLDNQVTYELTTTLTPTKDLIFNVVYTDGAGNEIQLYNSRMEKMTVTIPPENVTASVDAKFGYWDPRNECPVIEPDFEKTYPAMRPAGDTSWYEGRNNDQWQSGAIIDNNYDTGYIWAGYPPYPGESGMDFILEVDLDIANPSVAVNITKSIVDPDGTLIQPATTVSNEFHVYMDDEIATAADVADGYAVPPNEVSDASSRYENRKYELLREAIEIEVGSSGVSDIYYDYIPPGMVYIEEDPATIPASITDIHGQIWLYKGTRIETEYVWRDDDFTDKRHVVNNTSAVPDVLGTYTDSKGAEQFNRFLEFFVYNIYEKGVGSLRIRKNVLVNGRPPARLARGWKNLADGTYTFTVTSTTLNPAVTRTVTITFEGGVATGATIDGAEAEFDEDGCVVVTDLPPDTYLVEELPPDNNTVLMDGIDNPQQIVVSAGDTADVRTAEFINRIDLPPETSPVTGDSAKLGLWAALMLISFALLSTCLIQVRRRASGRR